jgi:hypothetical protein
MRSGAPVGVAAAPGTVATTAAAASSALRLERAVERGLRGRDLRLEGGELCRFLGGEVARGARGVVAVALIACMSFLSEARRCCSARIISNSGG